MANTHDNLTELFSGIAAAIRSKTGSTAKIKADNFPSAINAIEAGSGGITPVDTITIIANGNYDVTAYANAEVNVPTTGGDVVVSGEEIEVDSLSKLHSWSKYRIAGSVYETKVDTLSISSTGVNDTHYEPLDYASEYDTSSGKIVLVNPTENVTLKSTTAANVILGKYIQTYAKPQQYAETSSPTGNYYRIDSTATVNYSKTTYPVSGEGLTVSPAYRLTYTGSEEQFVGIVVSEDSTAYPQNGTQDGYKYVYNGTLDKSSCDHTSVTQATPIISVSDSGLITATSTQAAGLVSAGTKSATKQITHTNLTAENIKSGVSIFGVTGSYSGSSGSGVELPTLTSPGTAADLVIGKQFIDADGNVVTGTMGTLGFGGIVEADEDVEIAENDDGSKTLYIGGRTKNTVTKRVDPETAIIVTLTDTHEGMSVFGDATEDDVRAGKTFTSAAGFVKTGRATIGSGSTEQPKLDGAYVWQKCTIDHGWHYTTEELGTTKPSDLTGTGRQSFTITDDGYFELSTETSALGGYYSISGGNGKSIYYSVWKYASSGSYYTYSKLTLPNSANDAKGQFVSYVSSDSENAYPNNGASGGYWYVKLVAVDA